MQILLTCHLIAVVSHRLSDAGQYQELLALHCGSYNTNTTHNYVLKVTAMVDYKYVQILFIFGQM